MIREWYYIGLNKERPENGDWIVARYYDDNKVVKYDAGKYDAETQELEIDLGEVSAGQPLAEYHSWAHIEK